MIWHPVHISFPTAYFSSSVALNNKKIWIAWELSASEALYLGESFQSTGVSCHGPC